MFRFGFHLKFETQTCSTSTTTKSPHEQNLTKSKTMYNLMRENQRKQARVVSGVCMNKYFDYS